jgi:hypothetical protein
VVAEITERAITADPGGSPLAVDDPSRQSVLDRDICPIADVEYDPYGQSSCTFFI